ncbi:Metallo-dependent phosphatase-like protein [Nemania sp. NC0429]|nr:Metallo-dependent phosphatase-like protein [Nemania sp. NC0429]
MAVKTRILIISDTHGGSFTVRPEHKADVVIHCGDLTDESKLEEYRRTIQLIKEIDAPLKLAIAGNHDFTLDTQTFKQRLSEAAVPLEPELVRREYGDYGEARRLFGEAPGVTLLDEGTHKFHLQNGALLTVYASPYTPSLSGNTFQYYPDTGHKFDIGKETDIVITHGPPDGIMDRTRRGRAGSVDLFQAVARAQPRLHCFGHIHEEWGAMLVTWREHSTEAPFFKDIDYDRSTIIETLRRITVHNYDAPKIKAQKVYRAAQYTHQGYCATSCSHEDHGSTPVPNRRTLFVNAAVKGITDTFPMHPPWIVDIDLPPAHPQEPTLATSSSHAMRGD